MTEKKYFLKHVKSRFFSISVNISKNKVLQYGIVGVTESLNINRIFLCFTFL